MAYYPEEMAEKMRRIGEAAELKAREERDARRRTEESRDFLRLLFPKKRRG